MTRDRFSPPQRIGRRILPYPSNKSTCNLRAVGFEGIGEADAHSRESIYTGGQTDTFDPLHDNRHSRTLVTGRLESDRLVNSIPFTP